MPVITIRENLRERDIYPDEYDYSNLIMQCNQLFSVLHDLIDVPLLGDKLTGVNFYQQHKH